MTNVMNEMVKGIAKEFGVNKNNMVACYRHANYSDISYLEERVIGFADGIEFKIRVINYFRGVEDMKFHKDRMILPTQKDMCNRDSLFRFKKIISDGDQCEVQISIYKTSMSLNKKDVFKLIDWNRFNLDFLPSKLFK